MYTAPLKDIRFVLNDVIGMQDVLTKLGREDDVSPDLVDAILEEAGKLAADIIAPTNHAGDVAGCTHHNDGSVTTPSGFIEAYRAMAEGGARQFLG